MSLSRYQLERWDDARLIELGRRAAAELDAEGHRHMRTMGELLKARVFGSTQWAIDLRNRMNNYVQGEGLPVGETLSRPLPEPHKFPCEDPYCMPCAEAIKRIFRDLNLLPSGNPDRASYTADPVTGRLKVAPRYRKDESDR